MSDYKNKQLIFFKDNKRNLFFSVLAGILVSVSRLSIAWILQNVIDFISKKNTYSLIQLIIITIITFIVLGIALVLDCLFSPQFSTNAIKRYKDYIFSKIMNKSSDSFFEEDTATYLSLISNDIDKIKRDYLDQVEAFVEILLTLIGAVVIMIASSPILAVISLLISLIPLFVSIRIGKTISEKEKILSYRNADYISFVKDALAGFSVIKSFRAEKKVIDNHMEYNNNQIYSLKKREQAIAAVSSFSHFLGNITQISIFIVCAALTGKIQNITPGTVVLFIQLMNSVIRPIEQIPKMVVARKGVIGLIDKHDALLNKNNFEEGKQRLNYTDIDIHISSMSYSYDGNFNTLKNINLDFESGKCYLIVGESGSGKSTLLNVISGIRKNYQGSIKYGNIELKDVSRYSLFDYVSIIQQSVYIFNDTILNNITMYGDFNNNDIEKAISLAGLDNVIKEKGSDYICGESGNLLSGGEKQRISIARSILRKQKILFVDEGTSALDIETAKKINDSILQLAGTTRFIISHSMDIDLIHNCDEIIVVRNGEISEKGNFKELMNNQSYFYALYVLANK